MDKKITYFIILYMVVVIIINNNNSSISFCLSSSCRTDLSIHFQPSRPTTIWMIFWVSFTLSFSRFYYKTDHRKCEITLRGWHCGLRLLKLDARFTRDSSICMSLAWLACYTGQRATTCTTVVVEVVSSSSSSQDRPIGPLPAKRWPEAFHAIFIHNIQRKWED